MKHKGIISLLLGTLLLCFVLVGCGGGTSSADASAFIGTWDLYEITGDDGASHEDIKTMNDFGIETYLEIEKDGKGTFNVFGEDIPLTWKAKNNTQIDVTIEYEGKKQTEPLTLKDDKVSFSIEGEDSTMVFEKGKKHDKSDKSASGSGEGGTTALDSLMGNDSEQNVTEINSVVADDETIKIEAIKMYDNSFSDAVIEFKVTNKSDKNLMITCEYGSWSVDGKMVNPSMYEKIKAGAYADADLYFTKDELGGGTEKLVNIDGKFELTDDEYNTIATYEFKYGQKS